MTVLRLARSELKRMTYGLLPKLTILALVTVPLLYGAVYLYANWDPYRNMSRIPAALVVEDRGADAPDGTHLDAGNEVAQALVDGHLFDWHRVASAAEAEAGVRNGTYGFELTLPGDFSSNLASPASFDTAKQAMLQVTTNDANNYLLSTIVDKVTTAVHDSVAKQVGTETASRLLTGYGVIHGQVAAAADGAGTLADGLDGLRDGSVQLADGASQLHAGADQLVAGQTQLRDGASQLVAGQTQLRDGTEQLAAGSGQLASGLDQLRGKTSVLPGTTRQLADGASQVAAGNAALNQKVQSAVGAVDAADAAVQGRVKETTARLVTEGALTQTQADAILADVTAAQSSAPLADARAQLHTAAGQVQQLADGSQKVADGAAQLAGAMPALATAVGQADDGAHRLSQGASQLAAGQQSALDGAQRLAAGEQAALDGTQKLDDGAARLDSGAAQLRDGASQADDGAHRLAEGLAEGAGKVPNPSGQQVKDVSAVMGDPVAIDHVSQTKAASYGAGLAPFFLSLAMWVGIFMLMQAMRPFTVRALASNAPAWKIAVGGWLPFAVVAAVQATLLTAVVDFALGLAPAHPLLMWLFLLLGGIAFSAVIHGIVALLGTSGKFVVLILLILQLVSSGGTFPWQMTPEPFRIAHQVLPMGYVVQGMRHLIYGGDLSGILPTVVGLLGYTLLGGLLNIAGTRKSKTWRLKTLQPEIAV
ncbi:YhgE/Pip domain-containing protein [Sinomonas cellulolyticus]|uniref:YhgE/Pip domain-containing protein n=1 Tax=Sinomonas cellulolyticus TaxID=2801916 RepID=A0ABS1K2Y6_9MICC|nr:MULTISPECIES: YhgE/Pip domain-containing protein [Sinomonas]MBL0705863.1 YhgE/Pip domain-containing protein [Sinomonas cellulolyticus]